VKAVGDLGEDTTEEARAYDAGLTTGYDNGAEAMRAACWEAVKGQLQVFGMADGLLESVLKKAIEGATP